MKKVYKLPVLACLFVSGLASAGWSAWGKVSYFHVDSGAANRVYVEGIQITDVNCQNTAPVILFDGPQAPGNGKEMYSTALAAFMAGKEIRIYGISCWSEWSTPIGTAMEIR